MVVPQSFRIGIIGFGIGKVYATAFRNVNIYYDNLPKVELVGIATQSSASASQAERTFGFKLVTTDYKQLLANDEIDAIVIATPNAFHFPMLMDTLQAGKYVYVDKPLTNTLAEALQVLSIVRSVGKDGQVIFEMRFCPALQYAHELVHSGRLGDIYSFRAYYYRSSYIDPAKPLRWKASAEKSGTGALGDLAAHIIDLVSWLVGVPQRVAGQMRTFIPQRPAGGPGSPIVPVETDDHVILQASLPGGAIGTIEAGRMITGAMNDMQVEIYGSQASLRWNMMEGNYLFLADRSMPARERGWLQIPTISRYPNAFLPGDDVPAGMVRYHIASAAEFVRRTVAGKPYDPSLVHGAQVQAVIDATVQSVVSGGWVDVFQVGQ